MTKNKIIKIGVLVVGFWPVVGLAAGKTLADLISSLISTLATPIISLLFALSVGYFLWGVIKFIQSAGNEAERKKAQATIVWGLMALAVMISVWSLVNVLVNTFPDIEMNSTPTVQKY